MKMTLLKTRRNVRRAWSMGVVGGQISWEAFLFSVSHICGSENCRKSYMSHFFRLGVKNQQKFLIKAQTCSYNDVFYGVS